MTRGKPLSFDRHEVLEKAMDLFWERGYAQTGMTDLLNHMGIQRQSFYNTFGSKEEVYVESVRMYSQEMLSRINAILGQDRHPLESLQELFSMWKQMSETKEGCGCMMANSIAEFGLSKKTVGELLKEQVNGLYDAYYQAFTQAVERGYLAKDKDPRALAASLVAMSQGMALLSKLGFGEEMLEDIMKVTKNMLVD